MDSIWSAVFTADSRKPRTSQAADFYPLRDLSGRKIPGMPNVIQLPKGACPATYEDGVYIVGEIWMPVADVDRLSPFDRRTLLKHPHMLVYGHAGREMRAAESALIKRVAVAVAACLLLAHPVLGRILS